MNTVILSEAELQKLLSALDYLEKRQRFLARMATKQGRDREALARTDAAQATVALTEKLYALGAAQ